MKLNKNYYYRKNERVINCYYVRISKEMLKKTNIKDDDEIKLTVKDNKIIIEKEQKNG